MELRVTDTAGVLVAEGPKVTFPPTKVSRHVVTFAEVSDVATSARATLPTMPLPIAARGAGAIGPMLRRALRQGSPDPQPTALLLRLRPRLLSALLAHPWRSSIQLKAGGGPCSGGGG